MTETTNLPLITVEDLLATLEAVVAEKGADFVYNPGGDLSCYYAPIVSYGWGSDNDPRKTTGCLIGEALRRFGYEPNNSNEWLGGLRTISWQLNITDDALTVGLAAQSAQDAGLSWGVALKDAQEMASRIAAE